MASARASTRSSLCTVRASSRCVFSRAPPHAVRRSLADMLCAHMQFKDLDKGDRIRLSVDKGGERQV